MDYSTISTLPNLQPGSEGTDVKKLQQWLIQNGFSIPDGATGNYGPQTQAAVAQWQTRSGIDTKGNPGYFGPQSKAYAQTQTSGGANSSSGGTTQSSTSDADATDALHFLGFSDAQIAQMSPSDKQNFSLTGEYLKKQTDLGNVTAQNNAASLQQAYTAALNDPTLKAKYSDIQNSDQANFSNNLQAFQTGLDVDSANQKLSFQKAQKDLADQAAAGGQAYSGFRNQAKQQLDTQQSGIVTSTLSNIKQNLQASGAPLEQYYGTSQFNKLFGGEGINYMNPLTNSTQTVDYNPIGGISGTLTPEKSADVNARQQSIYQNISSPI